MTDSTARPLVRPLNHSLLMFPHALDHSQLQTLSAQVLLTMFYFDYSALNCHYGFLIYSPFAIFACLYPTFRLWFRYF